MDESQESGWIKVNEGIVWSWLVEIEIVWLSQIIGTFADLRCHLQRMKGSFSLKAFDLRSEFVTWWSSHVDSVDGTVRPCASNHAYFDDVPIIERKTEGKRGKFCVFVRAVSMQSIVWFRFTSRWKINVARASGEKNLCFTSFYWWKRKGEWSEI